MLQKGEHLKKGEPVVELGFQEPFRILERGNPVERGESIFERGTKNTLWTGYLGENLKKKNNTLT